MFIKQDRTYPQSWVGWHANCGCSLRRSTYERYHISMAKEYSAVVAEFVTMGRIKIAEQLIDAWVVVNIDSQAQWRWGAKYPKPFTQRTWGVVPRMTNPNDVHRDLLDVQVPWCNDWYRIFL